MGKYKGLLVCICILFLATFWPDGAFGAPPCQQHRPAVLPLRKQFFGTDLKRPQILPVTSSKNCNCLPQSLPSQNPVSYSQIGYQSPAQTSFIPGGNSADQNQQLLSEAKSLLNQMSYSGPEKFVIQNQETPSLQNLVNRLAVLKENGVVPAQPSSTLPAVSETTYNSILNEYLDLRLLIDDLLPSIDAQIANSALDTLYKTFDKIITGQLLNIELPNLCSATLALNSKLNSMNPPTEIQSAVADFLKLLTTALTGQSQVTILGLCDCLNDLETSVVTVVENDKSQKLQYLLSSLVDAVTNSVVSGGDVGCNVIDVVQRYVNNIKQAVKQDANARAGKIYSSVLNFEEELYRVLIESDPTAVTPIPLRQISTTPLIPETEDEYLAEIMKLSETLFGDRRRLVRSAIGSLLDIKRSENPSTKYPALKKTTLEVLKQVRDLLKAVGTKPQIDSTHVLEVITDLLSILPQSDIAKVLDALDPVPAITVDATDIVNNGDIFVINEKLVPQTNVYGNVDVGRSGTYKLLNPNTNDLFAGSYTVQAGIIESDSAGNIYVNDSGVYDVNPPPNLPSLARQGNFLITDNIIKQVDENGNPTIEEGGTYLLTDPNTGSSNPGNFVVINTISEANPDGSIELTKSGLVYKLPGEQPSLPGEERYFLFNDHILKVPDSSGNYGTGRFNMFDPDTKQYQSGTFVYQQAKWTTNPDKSVDIELIGLNCVDRTANSPLVTECLPTTTRVHIVYVTDRYGNIVPTATGEFSDMNPTTGIRKSGKFVISFLSITQNPDGSIDVTRFGRTSSLVTTAPTTEAPTVTSSYLEPTQPPTIPAASPLPIDQDFFNTLVYKPTPAEPLQPTPLSPGIVVVDPISVDPTSLSPVPAITVDATDIVNNGDVFVINEKLVPQSNVYEIVEVARSGTYYLVNPKTNDLFSGSYTVQTGIIDSDSVGNIYVNDSGVYNVNPPSNLPSVARQGTFSITDNIIKQVDENGNPTITESGTYLLTDPKTGSSNPGNFVVMNTISKANPDGSIELTKSGLVCKSPGEQPSLPGDGSYFLIYEHILKVPDSNGNYGTRIFNMFNPNTKQYQSGTSVIQQAKCTTNPDKSMDMELAGLNLVDHPANSPLVPSDPFSMATSATPFTSRQHIVYVEDRYGNIVPTATGEFTSSPTTGIIRSGKFVTSFLSITQNPDGSIDVTRFLRTLTVVTEASTTEAPTVTSSYLELTQPPTMPAASPLPINQDFFHTLVHKPTPAEPLQTTPLSPGIVVLDPTSVYPTYPVPTVAVDATDIVNNGDVFVVNEKLVPQSNVYGNVDVARSGTYYLVNPKTNDLFSGSYTVQTGIIDSDSVGNIYVNDSGVYNVNPPSNLPSVARQGTFSITDNIIKQVDENGNPTITESGTYLLTDPKTGSSNPGNFVVMNTISKANPDGSIELTKSGLVCKSPGEQPSLPGDGSYFLIYEHILKVPDSNGNYGTRIFNMFNPNTKQYQSGTSVIQQAKCTTNPDKSIDIELAGLNFVDPPANSPLVPSDLATSGIPFTVREHIVYVTDRYGNIVPIATGEYTVITPNTGIMRSGKFITSFASITENLDGSIDLVKFGRVLIIVTTASTTEAPTITSSYLKLTQPPAIPAASPLPIDQDVFHTLVDKPTPAEPLPQTTQLPPTNYPVTPIIEPLPTDCITPKSTNQGPTYDATSTINDGTSFVIEQLITPLVDADGRVFDELKMGTYHFADATNYLTWFGAFEVEDSFTELISPGLTEITDTGRFDVYSPDDSICSKIKGQFVVEDRSLEVVDESGNFEGKEEGTYSVTDRTTGASKAGHFVVHNTISVLEAGGAVRVIKSGLLFVNEPNATYSYISDKPSVPNYNQYFLSQNHVFDTPDSNGDIGTGMYSLKDSITNDYTIRTYTIQKVARITNPDGTIDDRIEGFIDDDDSTPNLTQNSSGFPSLLLPGMQFTIVDHITNGKINCGQVSLVGTGQITQTDPKTGITRSATYKILNIVSNNGADGSYNVQKFYGFPNVDDKTPTKEYLTTSPAPMISDPYTTSINLLTPTPEPIVNDPSQPTVVPVKDNTTPSSDLSTSAPAPITVHPYQQPVDPVYDGTTSSGDLSTSTPAPIIIHPYQHPVDPVYDGTTSSGDLSTSTPAPIIIHPYQHPVDPVYDGSTSSADDVLTPTPAPTVEPTVVPIYYASPSAPMTLESVINSLNPMKPMPPSFTQVPKSPYIGETNPATANPIRDILTDGTFFVVDAHVVPRMDSNGNIIGLDKTGKYSFTDPQTNVTWSGNFDIDDCVVKATAPGEIDVTQSGTFDVDQPDNSSSPANPKYRPNFFIKDHVSVTVDESGISRVAEGGKYTMSDPTTGESKTGTFMVTNSVSITNPDGSMDVVKSGILSVDKVSPPSEQLPLVSNGGYFLTKQHLLSVPDSNGNYGTGFYNFKDPQTNEYTSGSYLIQKAFTVHNPDGTDDVTTIGIIYVDGSQSSSPTTNSDPSLAVINGAQFTFVDHLTYVTDPYGHITIVGTGTLLQTDPTTGSTTTGQYLIRSVVNKDNPDGSQDQIEAGIFYLTTTSQPIITSTLAPPITPPCYGPESSTPPATLSEINVSLQALINSLASLSKPASPAFPQQYTPSQAVPTYIPLTPTPVPGLNPQTTLPGDYVVLPRLSVVSAMNGQCLSPGDIVVVQDDNGYAFLAKIQDFYTPVTFHLISLTDLGGIFGTSSKVFIVQENDFSKQDRSRFDAVFKYPGSPNCLT